MYSHAVYTNVLGWKVGGAGVIRMVNACQLQGVPKPYYEERPGGIASVCDAANLFRTNTNLA